MTKKLFQNKKVLVMGLGLHGGGVGVAKFFCKQGAHVLVTDLKTQKQLKESILKLKGLKIKYTLGNHEEKDFLNTDLIIKNPDVPSTSPYLEIARKNKIQIETDISLFFKLSEAFVIGVTGTKGKSTTSSLIFHLLKAKYKRIFLAGNIGVSPLDLISKIKKGDKVVLELSSFELEDLKQSPNLAVITNIMPDHLNRYASMAEYVESKKIIFKYQNTEGVLVLNADDATVKSFAKEANSKVCFFSERDVNLPIVEFNLLGQHNLSNLSAAVSVAKLLDVPESSIKKSVKSFKGVPNRQEFVKEVNGVKYFNDTTATIPEAVISAIDSFSDKFPEAKIYLICGGVYKGVTYKEFAVKVKEKKVALILLPGNASDKIKESLVEYRDISEVSSMEAAVGKAKESAKKGDLVVLSPGASSFNLFKNEFDRASQFIKAVKKSYK
jgi:UDP-N-acetylmuramoylalanine--D-glutamate ligase